MTVGKIVNNGGTRKADEQIVATIALPAGVVVVRSEARWISRSNVEAVYGRPWRWLLDQLPALRAAGVAIAGSRKAPMVEATGLDAYLRTQAASALSALTKPANDAEQGDEIDRLLASGGTMRAGRRR